MNVLAFDTASSACSAAVLRDGEIAASRSEPMDRGHAGRLVPMLDEMLAAVGLGYDDLDRIAVTVGPGAFTGIRIGLATARGITVATAVPAVGVTTFASVAATIVDRAFADGPVLIALETKRRDLYVQLFASPKRAVGAPGAVMPDGLAAWIGLDRLRVAGDAAARAAEGLKADGIAVELVPDTDRIDPETIARLAAEAPLPDRNRPPLPLYLRPPAVTLGAKRP